MATNEAASRETNEKLERAQVDPPARRFQLASLFAHRPAPNPGVGVAADGCTFLDSPSIAADGTGPDLANGLGGWWLAIMSLGIGH
jgi:hypothetical protein